jgi:hypothetical protein
LKFVLFLALGAFVVQTSSAWHRDGSISGLALRMSVSGLWQAQMDPDRLEKVHTDLDFLNLIPIRPVRG